MRGKFITALLVSLIALGLSVTNVWAWKMKITSDTTLTGDLDCTDGNGILINASNVTLDCAGHTINCTGASPGYGIHSNGKSNITIRNCVIKDFMYGIYLKSGSDFLITHNTVDLRDSTYAYCRAIRLRYVSDSTVKYNNIEGSTYLGITVETSSSTGNTIQFNNIKNCPKNTASDSGTGNTWESNYYDDAIDYDCDGMTTYVISRSAIDFNAYVVENGWDGLPTYTDADGDGYGENCQLGLDCNDNDPLRNEYGPEIVFGDFGKGKMHWKYLVCESLASHPEQEVTVSTYSGPLSPDNPCMMVEFKNLDVPTSDHTRWTDVFRIDHWKGLKDWSNYHTLTCKIYPENPNRQTTHLSLRLDNDPKCAVNDDDVDPICHFFDDDCREAQSSFTLVSNTWNKIFWDLSMNIYAGGDYTPGDPRPVTRDDLKSLRFFLMLGPRDYDDGQNLTLYIDDIRLLRDWKNHGEYVSCVARGGGDVPGAAQSDVGKKSK